MTAFNQEKLRTSDATNKLLVELHIRDTPCRSGTLTLSDISVVPSCFASNAKLDVIIAVFFVCSSVLFTSYNHNHNEPIGSRCAGRFRVIRLVLLSEFSAILLDEPSR